MTIQEIQRALATEPFEPFRIHVADGNWYDVRHRENLAFSGKGRIIAVAMPDDSFVHVDLLLVTAIERPIPKARARRKAS
jgi:hypothetical protein